MSNPLAALVNIITTQVNVLEEAYATANTPIPSLDAPFAPNALDFNPSLASARHLIVAAASQLIATVQSPMEFMMDSGAYLTAALGIVQDTNIVDILIEAGPEGLHVDKISALAEVDTSHISRILRYLATRHIFKELTPNVFTNNKFSSLLKKPKTLKEIKDDPASRFDGAPICAFVSSFADENLSSVTHMSQFVQNSGSAKAPFNLALKTDKTMFEWFDEPGNEWRSRRFTAAMQGSGHVGISPDIFIRGIKERNLKDGDVVVDVGGDSGAITLILKNALPTYKYIVQDLPKPIAAGEKFWAEKDPEAVKTGVVTLQVHDFFKPQPVKNAAVYFLRFVLHDWCDADARKILTQLREAAGPDSKLVVFDNIARHTCEDPVYEELKAKTAGVQAKVPYPLLANLGVGGAGLATSADMLMLNMFNGKERTPQDFEELGQATGWKLEYVSIEKVATHVYAPA